jgi:hypothetical protein
MLNARRPTMRNLPRIFIGRLIHNNANTSRRQHISLHFRLHNVRFSALQISLSRIIKLRRPYRHRQLCSASQQHNSTVIKQRGN